MFKYTISLLICLSLAGCSLITMEQRHYKPLSRVPSEKPLSFRSKEALATGATLQNQTAAKIYYQGTKPKSPEAKILYEMSYRFMDLAGVNTNFDPDDPESVAKVFHQADKALEEKDKAIHDLRVQVQKNLKELAMSKKIIRDKEAELVSTTGKWRARFDTLWRWIWGVIIFGVVLLIGLGIAQVVTGIPFLTIFFGGVRLLSGTVKQTIRGIEEVRKELKHQIQNSRNEEERKKAKEMLTKLDASLSVHQDEKVKKYVKTLKAKHFPDLKTGGAKIY